MKKHHIKNLLKDLIKETIETLKELNELQLMQDGLLENYIRQLKAGDEIHFLVITEKCLETSLEESFEKTRYLKFLTQERTYYAEQLKAFN